MRGGWRSALPELTITCVMVAATTVGAYCYAGLATASLVVMGWAAVVLVLFRSLIPIGPEAPEVRHETTTDSGQSGYIGFWRQRGMLVDASASMRSYDGELRSTLQHLLAARLAERPGISLYSQPAEARRALAAADGGDQLWYWLDPERPAEQRSTLRGIPRQTLTAIIDRLEQI